MTEGNLQLEAVYDSAKEQEAPVQEEQFFSNRKKDDYKKSNAVTITTEEVQTDKKLMLQTNTLKTSTAQTPQNGQTTPNLMYYITQLTVQKPRHCHLCSSKFNTQPMVLFFISADLEQQPLAAQQKWFISLIQNSRKSSWSRLSACCQIGTTSGNCRWPMQSLKEGLKKQSP